MSAHAPVPWQLVQPRSAPPHQHVAHVCQHRPTCRRQVTSVWETTQTSQVPPACDLMPVPLTGLYLWVAGFLLVTGPLARYVQGSQLTWPCWVPALSPSPGRALGGPVVPSCRWALREGNQGPVLALPLPAHVVDTSLKFWASFLQKTLNNPSVSLSLQGIGVSRWILKKCFQNHFWQEPLLSYRSTFVGFSVDIESKSLTHMLGNIMMTILLLTWKFCRRKLA